MAKKMTPAQKANRTRQMKTTLTREYGEDTAFVVMAALHNNKARLNEERDIQGATRVAAILANLTRGSYGWIVD